MTRAAAFYAYVRNQVAHFHGVTSSTIMRGECYGFYLLGTFVERADMTARILDVKYHWFAVFPLGNAVESWYDAAEDGNERIFTGSTLIPDPLQWVLRPFKRWKVPAMIRRAVTRPLRRIWMKS